MLLIYLFIELCFIIHLYLIQVLVARLIAVMGGRAFIEIIFVFLEKVQTRTKKLSIYSFVTMLMIGSVSSLENEIISAIIQILFVTSILCILPTNTIWGRPILNNLQNKLEMKINALIDSKNKKDK